MTTAMPLFLTEADMQNSFQPWNDIESEAGICPPATVPIDILECA